MRIPSPIAYIVLYVVLYAAFGAASPFWPKFFETRALASQQIGLILAAAMLTRLGFGPLVAVLADRLGSLRLVLAGCAAVAAAAALALLWADKFWFLLLVALVQAAALAPTTSIADALSVNAARPRFAGRPFEYGWIRGAASAAFVLGTLIAGQLVSPADLTPVIWMNAAFLIAAASATALLPGQARSQRSPSFAVSEVKALISVSQPRATAGMEPSVVVPTPSLGVEHSTQSEMPLPTQSITEDILLTLVLLRKGYITRYLREPLAIGLAPESLDAFFVQRQRWARGAIQTLYLAAGPLGPGLGLMQRLLFFPTHWLSLGLRALAVVVVPIVFMWTGLVPVVDVTPESVFYYLFPAILALNGGISWFAPHEHFPLAAQVSATIQSFKLLPTVLGTLVKPKGHAFRVTPKGAAARCASYAADIFWPSAALIALTVVGLVLNTIPEWRIIDHPAALPMVAFWSVVNIVVLFFVCMTSLQARMGRTEERFEIDEPILINTKGGEQLSGQIKDISLAGAGILADSGVTFGLGAPLRVHFAQVGWIDATLMQRRGQSIGVRFNLPSSLERDLLIRKLFTGILTRANDAVARAVNRAMFKNLWSMHARCRTWSKWVRNPPWFRRRSICRPRAWLFSPRPRANVLAHLAGVRSDPSNIAVLVSGTRRAACAVL